MTDTPDLFGFGQAFTPEERKKLMRRVPKRRGHAAVPGTGPDGERCGTCRHLYRNRMAKTYLKCGLMQPYWTGGHGSDVGARDAACRRWEARHE